MTHHCHAIKCPRECPPKHLFCAYHWRKTPGWAQALIWRYYRPGQETDKLATIAYLRAQRLVVISLYLWEIDPSYQGGMRAFHAETREYWKKLEEKYNRAMRKAENA